MINCHHQFSESTSKVDSKGQSQAYVYKTIFKRTLPTSFNSLEHHRKIHGLVKSSLATVIQRCVLNKVAGSCYVLTSTFTLQPWKKPGH